MGYLRTKRNEPPSSSPQTQPTKLQTAFSNHIVAVGGTAVILQYNVCVTSEETIAIMCYFNLIVPGNEVEEKGNTDI